MRSIGKALLDKLGTDLLAAEVAAVTEYMQDQLRTGHAGSLLDAVSVAIVRVWGRIVHLAG